MLWEASAHIGLGLYRVNAFSIGSYKVNSVRLLTPIPFIICELDGRWVSLAKPPR